VTKKRPKGAVGGFASRRLRMRPCLRSPAPRISNADLARAAFVTPQTMQAILVHLERGGLFVRSPHPEHGRIIMTAPTPAGQRSLPMAPKLPVRWNRSCSPGCRLKRQSYSVIYTSVVPPRCTASPRRRRRKPIQLSTAIALSLLAAMATGACHFSSQAINWSPGIGRLMK
jgi:hypothetical protein